MSPKPTDRMKNFGWRQQTRQGRSLISCELLLAVLGRSDAARLRISSGVVDSFYLLLRFVFPVRLISGFAELRIKQFPGRGPAEWHRAQFGHRRANTARLRGYIRRRRTLGSYR